MNNIKSTIGGIALLAVGAFGGATLTDTVTAESLVRIDDKTAVETRQVEVILDIAKLREEVEFIQFNKTKLNTSCNAQIDIYNTKIDEVRAKIQSLKDLGIE